MNHSLLAPAVQGLLVLLSWLSVHSHGRRLICLALQARCRRRGRPFTCERWEPRLWNEFYVVAFCGFSAWNLFVLSPGLMKDAAAPPWLVLMALGVVPAYRVVEIFKTVGSIIFIDREARFVAEDGPAVGSHYALLGNSNSWLLMIFIGWVDMVFCFSILALWYGDQWNEPVVRPHDAFYFCTVTMVTLGYGDLVPKTEATKTLVITQLFCFVGYFLLVFPVAVASLRTKELRR